MDEKIHKTRTRKSRINNNKSGIKKEKKGGRQKGTLNKVTAETKDVIIDIVKSQSKENIIDSFDKLRKNDDFQYLKMYLEYCKVILPKIIDLNPDGDEPKKIIQLTDKQFNEMNKILR